MDYGLNRLLADLKDLDYENLSTKVDSEGKNYVVISNYKVILGIFEGKIIDLAIPAPDDFPRSIGACIHVKASPILFEKGNVPPIRNIQDSKLGEDWQYWSFTFRAVPENPTKDLMEQINGVFRKIK